MLTVAIASGDQASSAQLVASLEQTGLVRSIRQWAIPMDRIPETSDNMPDVVFLDLGRDSEPYFSFASLLRRVHPATKLIACSATTPQSHQILLEAMRSGVQDFISKPVNAESLKAMLVRFAEEMEIKGSATASKLIVVMGSKGGVGATTVTVNLGVQLATFARKRVVVLDFARPLGNIHLLLDLHPRFGIRDAVENLDRLDSHFFSGLLTHHKTNLDVLGGATQPEEWQRIPVPVLERVVNVAQNNFDLVLLDMGSQFSSEWSPILGAARMIMVVAEANVPALWTLDRRLAAMSGFGLDPERARIIINRWHKGDEEVLKSIQKNINRPLFACIPNDFRKASEAVNLGTPILENHNNLLSMRYRQIAAQLAGMDANAASKKGSLGGFFSFPTKR
ncbi:MAG TPA: AAA family ATPase [Candidatus Acidoferrales bacterium]|nr:AAA family ATPase [Candidatus Acidoferrales bacterium]